MARCLLYSTDYARYNRPTIRGKANRITAISASRPALVRHPRLPERNPPMVPFLIARVLLIESSKALIPVKGEWFAVAHDAPVAVAVEPAAPKAGKKVKPLKPLKGQTGADCTGLICHSGARVQFAPGEHVVEHVSLARLTPGDDAAARFRVAKSEARSTLALALGGSVEGSAERKDTALLAIARAWNAGEAAFKLGVASNGTALDLVFMAASIASPAEVREAFGRIADEKNATPRIAPASAMLRDPPSRRRAQRASATVKLGATSAGAALEAMRQRAAKLAATPARASPSLERGAGFFASLLALAHSLLDSNHHANLTSCPT